MMANKDTPSVILVGHATRFKAYQSHGQFFLKFDRFIVLTSCSGTLRSGDFLWTTTINDNYRTVDTILLVLVEQYLRQN